MTQKTTGQALKQRVFSNYQRMLTFAINLCYKDVDYSVEVERGIYKVRYMV